MSEIQEIPAAIHSKITLNLSTIIDLDCVKECLESLCRLSGMTYSLMDVNGNTLIKVGWQNICSRFHRVHPGTWALCQESDDYLKGYLHGSKGEILEYRCKNGLIDIAMPIIINRRHMASILTGQFFYEDDPPDRNLFVAQSEAFGFDKDEYLKALDEVPRFSRQHVHDNIIFLQHLVQALGEIGLKNLLLAREMEERKRAEDALHEKEALLRDLVARKEAIQEEERRRVAREIHDQLGSYLSALRLNVNLLLLNLGKAKPDIAKTIAKLLDLVDTTIQVSRDVASSLRPATLDMGIVPALDWLAAAFTRSTGIPCKAELPPSDVSMDEEKAVAIFRIVQESLTNVARHAKATMVQIALESEPGAFVVEVKDNGIGFDTSAPRKEKTLGLMGISERAMAVGGELTISSQPGEGTLVRLRIPAEEARQEES
jgi:signal transduction histidine kinase